MQLAARLRDSLGRDVPVRWVFEHPTVAALAAHLDTTTGQPAHLDAGPRAGTARAPYRPSFAQRRLWLAQQLAPSRTDYHVPLLARLHGPLDAAALRGALTALVARHDVLRTRFTLTGDGLSQVVDQPAPLAVSEDAMPDHGAESDLPARLGRPFDLGDEWPIRAHLRREGPDRHLLLLLLHHVASDGWSGGVLLRDLAELYRAARDGTPATLPQVPLRFVDYAAWETDPERTAGWEGQLGHWRDHFTDIPTVGLTRPPAVPPPADRPGSSVPIPIDDRLRASIADLASQASVTVFSVLHAALAVLIARESGTAQVRVGTDVARRDRPELLDLVGPLVNQAVLATDLRPGTTPRAAVRAAADARSIALAHAEVPYEQVARSAGRQGEPLFTTKIVYEDSILPRQLGDLTVEFVTVPQQRAKFDTTLFFWADDDTLTGVLQFAHDVLDEAGAVRVRDAYLETLRRFVTSPDGSIDGWEGNDTPMQQPSPQPTGPVGLRAVRPRPVALTDATPPPETAPPVPVTADGVLPRLVTAPPDRPGLAAFAARHRGRIDEWLPVAGAVLFRGFAVDSAETFEAAAAQLCTDLFTENGEHVPVLDSGHVQTPVFFPPERKLLWHNENSFNARWPHRLVFCCLRPADSGGATPLVDGRKLYARLDPALRRRFSERQVRYERCYQRGVGLTWQQVFGTDDRAEVERVCAAQDMRYEWLPGDRLRTTCVRPAVVAHPVTGEPCWFTQAQHWHPYCLDEATRAGLRAMYGDDALPRDCRYGDGSPIPDEDMAEVLAAYADLEVTFAWQPGDVLLVDNVATAHARNPFHGERTLLVALGDPGSFADVRLSRETGGLPEEAS
ncbi:condensation domain-containing protein [Micromonospora marina]|uniref:Non-ribosomal peptide synthetase component F n=2 Tax=Micromonospora marina TaxID=307120 RepID=A0A1C4ZMF9_9ACTN|nr:condensation domain-containing protein [Micromonospora marina]SCF33964.1 Non-ribosomal peptide synthetase component F [Micromonospora marina]